MRFLPAPLAHISTVGCLSFISFREKNKSHCRHCIRGRLPSSGTTIVSCIWRCTKWTQSLVQLEALPWHPSIVHTTLRASQSKEILYIWINPRGGWWGVPIRSPVPTPCCNWLLVTRDTTNRSTLHSGQRMRRRRHYWCVWPSPVIYRLKEYLEWPIMAQHGWHDMLNVLSTLICNPTWSNSSVNTWNNRCILTPFVDARMPLSA